MKNLNFMLFLCLVAGHAQAQSEEPFTYVEIMPKFPGGQDAMYKFIADNFVYPKICTTSKKPIHLVVQFTVDTSGYLINPKVMRGYTCGVNEESLRVVGLMNEMDPRWTPGMHNGRKVPVNFTLPIMFVKGKFQNYN